MQNVVKIWNESLLIFSRMWERRGSLNGFYTHNLSNIVLTLFYLLAPLAIFFLIRHLPASGVFIIYRKLITYTRLQGSHLLHWLLQKQLHTMGPWARAWDYWFSQELTDLIAAKCTWICQPFPRYFCFHTSVVSNVYLDPLKCPKLLNYKREAVCHTPDCQYHQGFGV